MRKLINFAKLAFQLWRQIEVDFLDGRVIVKSRDRSFILIVDRWTIRLFTDRYFVEDAKTIFHNTFKADPYVTSEAITRAYLQAQEDYNKLLTATFLEDRVYYPKFQAESWVSPVLDGSWEVQNAACC